MKLYSLKAISVASFFGGPIAAGILLRRNFLNMGQPGKAMRAIVLNFLLYMLVVGIMLMFPMDLWRAKAMLPAIYAALLILFIKRNHEGYLDLHEYMNRKFYSVWRAAGIGMMFNPVFYSVPFYLLYTCRRI
jgi:hypothetical protein